MDRFVLFAVYPDLWLHSKGKLCINRHCSFVPACFVACRTNWPTGSTGLVLHWLDCLAEISSRSSQPCLMRNRINFPTCLRPPKIQKSRRREKGKASLVSAWCCIASTSLLFQLWDDYLVAYTVLFQDYIKHLVTDIDVCSGDVFCDNLANSWSHASILAPCRERSWYAWISTVQ